MIRIVNLQKNVKVSTPLIKNQAKSILRILRLSKFDLSIQLVDDAKIQEYNLYYRKLNEPTDVISIPFRILKPGQKPKPTPSGDRELGDLFLGMDYIQNYCQNKGISLHDHMTVLLVHGICHLLGYEHETDDQTKEMKEKEASILAALSSSTTPLTDLD